MTNEQEDRECRQQLGLFFGNFTVTPTKTKLGKKSLEKFRDMCARATVTQTDFYEFFHDKKLDWAVLDNTSFEMFINHPCVRYWYQLIWCDEFAGDPDKIVFMNYLIKREKQND